MLLNDYKACFLFSVLNIAAFANAELKWAPLKESSMLKTLITYIQNGLTLVCNCKEKGLGWDNCKKSNISIFHEQEIILKGIF